MGEFMNKINEYNQIVFYDLEMMGEKENDIIAIGAVKCGRDLKIIDRFHSYIKPIGERYISEFLSRLTGINQENIDNAESFQESMIKFFHGVMIKSAFSYHGVNRTILKFL